MQHTQGMPMPSSRVMPDASSANSDSESHMSQTISIITTSSTSTPTLSAPSPSDASILGLADMSSMVDHAQSPSLILATLDITHVQTATPSISGLPSGVVSSMRSSAPPAFAHPNATQNGNRNSLQIQIVLTILGLFALFSILVVIIPKFIPKNRRQTRVRSFMERREKALMAGKGDRPDSWLEKPTGPAHIDLKVPDAAVSLPGRASYQRAITRYAPPLIPVYN